MKLPCCKSKNQCPLVIKIGIQEEDTDNQIKTTRYNIFTFLPLATLVQFKRVANVYFLITAILQFIPLISPLAPYSAITPLVFVLAVSLLRTAVQEIGKYKFDRKANSAQFEVYISDDSQQTLSYNWETKRSDQIKVGDIIKIHQNQRIPADAILLSTTNSDTKAYIETSSLDGQKNLKGRSVLSITQYLYGSYGQNSTKQSIYMQKPLLTIQEASEQLYNFNGMIETKNHQTLEADKQFLKINQFLYRDCVLRNTKQVIAVVIYTGKYTKIMLNGGQRSEKMSKLERKVNYYMIFIFLIQLLLVILSGVLHIVFYYSTSQGQAFIIQIQQQNLIAYPAEAAITVGSYFILLNTMIPISLLVSIQIVKFGQGLLIEYDNLMKPKPDSSVNAFRSSINEQLGMVQYIFTDKTGTLTKNQMALRELYAGAKGYHHESQSNQAGNQFCNKNLSKILPHDLTFLQELYDLKRDIKKTQKLQKNMANLLVFIMAVCHQCILTEKKDGKPQYQGPSPDEIALVSSAANLGMKFESNKLSTVNLKFGTDDVNVKLLDLFQFNSDRKRMSVIIEFKIKENEKPIQMLLCKGADSVIEELLDNNNSNFKKQTQQFVTQLSRQGLRTLLFGYRFIEGSEYQNFKNSILEISESNQQKKQELIRGFQTNLLLVGASGVEDKLQDNVGATISDFIRANIKVSMLTGDKMETAENIATTCGLFKEDLKVYKIQSGNALQDLFESYSEVKISDEQYRQYGIIVQGQAINQIITSLYFLQLFKHCSAAVFCRITPKNKAEMVNFAKTTLNKLTLAIGDGANDVPMIMQANIGIGLYGNEGMNAVQASDFAIPQFRALWRLIFVHGRWNYIRIADLIKYFFYKNIVYTLGQLWFGYFCSFSGQSIYDATYLVMYNTIFTGCPVLVRALLEQDINYMQVISEEKLEKQSGDLKEALIPLEELKSKKQQPDKIRIPISIPLNEESEVYPFPSNVRINPYLEYLFPKLYSFTQSEKPFTPYIFMFIMIEAAISSILIFLIIYYTLELPELSIYSITLYTTILALVTVRIIYQVTYWNILLVLTILLTSIVPYVIFIYVMDIIEFTLYGTFIQVFTLPDFYLIVLLSASLAAIVMGVFGVFRKYYDPTELETVRKQVKETMINNYLNIQENDKSKGPLKPELIEMKNL